METVPRIHVQELFTAVKQQYQAACKRGVLQGPHIGPATKYKSGGSRKSFQEFDDRGHKYEFRKRSERRERRSEEGRDTSGEGGRTSGTRTGEVERGGREVKGVRSGGEIKRLDTAETVFLLRGRQTG